MKGVIGTTGFLDDLIDSHAVAGGAVRIRLFRGLSVEPEFLYMHESSLHNDFAFQASVTWEFRGQTGIRPYVVGGAGVLHSRFDFPGAREEQFTFNEFTGGGGGGVRVRVGARWWVRPEFRLGWEPLIRATVAVGYSFP